MILKKRSKNLCYKGSNFRVCEKVDRRMKARQLSLVPRKREDYEYGGSLLVGKRKRKRPVSTKAPMHLVLKSQKAKGKFAFNPSNRKIKNLIFKMGHCFQVRILTVALNWSHIHLVVQVRERKSYVNFIRALTGAMVLLLKAPKGFFDLRPYTKIGTWGRQLRNWFEYSVKNQIEAAGLNLRKSRFEKTARMFKEDSFITT